MTNITASMVKELREMTSAGMLDCKKALNETNGDMEAAVDWLRTKGLASAAKKAGRIAAEGLIAITNNGNTASIVEVNSETDFVAKNDLFQEFVKDAALVAMEKGGDVSKIGEFHCPKAKKPFAERLADLIAKIGENMNLRRAKTISVENGVISSYLHNSVSEGLGKIGVLIAFESKADKQKLQDFGRTIAMHIAASAPLFKDISEVSADALEREKAIFSEQALASGKPANIIEKMVEGRVRKYYDEVVLEEQSFIMDGDKKVKQVILDMAKELGSNIVLKEFVMFKLGEGIEKKSEDFAAEVAAQIAK